MLVYIVFIVCILTVSEKPVPDKSVSGFSDRGITRIGFCLWITFYLLIFPADTIKTKALPLGERANIQDFPLSVGYAATSPRVRGFIGNFVQRLSLWESSREGG